MQLIDKFYGKLVWVMTGFLFAVAVSLMLISGTFHLDRFYDVGKVYDIPKSSIMETLNDTMSYDQIEQTWVVNSENAIKNFVLLDTKGGWNYIYISLSNLNEADLNVRFDFYDSNEMLLCQASSTLLEGDNVLETPNSQFSRLDIVLENQAGVTFRIDKLQLREKAPIFSMERFVGYTIPLFVAFLLITGIVFRLFKNRMSQFSWYAPVHGLQKLFIYVGGYGEKLSLKYADEKKGLMRSGLFAFIFLLMQISFIFNFYNTNAGFRYLALMCVCALIGISFLCWEKTLHHLNWNNKFVLSWFSLWGLSVLSDIVVIKRYAYMGYIMVFVIGFLFFMWGNMEHREWLIRDFVRGIQWTFLPNLLFCWFFRPYISGYRYMGSSYSPGVFALYVLFVWLAFLAELTFEYKKRGNFAKDCVYVAVLGICGSFLWKTQSISSLLPAALAVLIFSLKFWLKRRECKWYRLPILFLTFVVGFMINSYCIYNIPRMLGTEIKFEKDFYLDTVTEHPFTLTVQAAEEGNENRILYKLKTSTSLETLTSGRTLYWKAYLRDMNLWGHRSKAYLLGAYRMPHNGYIAIMYRYGIFAVIPYILMVLYNLCYAVRYFWRHLYEDKKYSFFVLAVMLCCVFLLFVENLELPLGWLCWYGMYIIMGVYFDDEKKVESMEAAEKVSYKKIL